MENIYLTPENKIKVISYLKDLSFKFCLKFKSVDDNRLSKLEDFIDSIDDLIEYIEFEKNVPTILIHRVLNMISIKILIFELAFAYP